jgi:hypothetical protein
MVIKYNSQGKTLNFSKYIRHKFHAYLSGNLLITTYLQMDVTVLKHKTFVHKVTLYSCPTASTILTFLHFSFTTVQAGPRASMDALNKENLMPLLGFGPQFHCTAQISQKYSFLCSHNFTRDGTHIHHLLHQNTNVCCKK